MHYIIYISYYYDITLSNLFDATVSVTHKKKECLVLIRLANEISLIELHKTIGYFKPGATNERTVVVNG